jgi:hypothetical protein
MNIHVRKPVAKLLLDMGATNVTTGAWTQITAAIGAPVSSIQIFNGSGSVLKIATGGAGNEVAMNFYIIPGTVSPVIPVEIAKNSRISVQAADVDAVDGSLVLNCFG